MSGRAWWKRWDGLPWEKEPDADERAGFLFRFLSAQIAKLVIALVVVVFGFAVSLVVERTWLAGLIWTVVGITTAYGSYVLWDRLRDGRR